MLVFVGEIGQLDQGNLQVVHKLKTGFVSNHQLQLCFVAVLPETVFSFQRASRALPSRLNFAFVWLSMAMWLTNLELRQVLSTFGEVWVGLVVLQLESVGQTLDFCNCHCCVCLIAEVLVVVRVG